MVEIGHIELEIKHDGKLYTLKFNTEEKPTISGFNSVEFADNESETLAEKIGFEITKEFVSELYIRWGSYSNEHFRG